MCRPGQQPTIIHIKEGTYNTGYMRTGTLLLKRRSLQSSNKGVKVAAAIASELRFHGAANIIEMFMLTLVDLQTTPVLDSELVRQLHDLLRGHVDNMSVFSAAIDRGVEIQCNVLCFRPEPVVSKFCKESLDLDQLE
ncbi:hypothetical protein TNCV_5103431 [Trichonephila clavipes]|nr:hypothetical protein TNCV_5103431 [Trichonephila clavipes]